MKRFLLFFFLLLVILIGISGGLYWSSAQVPEFYQEALQQQVKPEVRQQEAKEFVQHSMQIVNDVRNKEPLWSQEFSEQQVNAWLAEELHQKYNEWVPEGITNPRVRFESNQVEIGFHLTLEKWAGIISLKLKPWLMKDNRLVLELEHARAGLLPIPIDEAITKLIQEARAEGWQIEWGQVNDHDALVVYLDRSRKDLPDLTTLKVKPGVFQIAGKANPERN